MKGKLSHDGHIVVRGVADGFVQEVSAGKHRLRSDESASVGGTDMGPSPYDLRARLLAIADRCPVHRTLSAKIHIRNKLVRERSVAGAGLAP
jgi:uncharacterized OsmC-like protein